MLLSEIKERREELTEGEYRVMNVAGKWLLTDSTGVLPFQPANFESGRAEYSPTQGEMVSAELVIEYLEGEVDVGGRVTRRMDVPSRPLLALPFSSLPRPELVVELDRLIQGMGTKELRGFLTYVFQHEQLALNFVKVPASGIHHHNEAGGLLRHVVEMVRYARDGQFPIEVPRYERELLMTALVLHDLGKAEGERESSLYRSHEDLGIAIMEEPLKWLEEEYPRVAKDVADVINDMTSRTSLRRSRVGLLLDFLDRCSAFADTFDRSFRDVPGHYRYAHLDGKGGKGRTFRRFTHLHLVGEEDTPDE